MLRFRLGLIVGFAIGYVLGTRAGHERYEQLRELWQQVRSSKPAQQIGSEVSTAKARAWESVEERAADGLARVTAKARSREPEPGHRPVSDPDL